MKHLPLVAIRCITYNHEPYIRDTLEGFVMQKTDFPFIAIVHDDASTDGTADIIREYAEKYPDIIKPIYETENQYSKREGRISRIMHQACMDSGAKYVAFCDGDDYWVDDTKLQAQVSFLEENIKYGLSYTQCSRLYEKTGQISKINNTPHTTFEQLIYYNSITTATVVTRMSILSSYYEDGGSNAIKSALMSDYQLWLWISLRYKIHYLPKVTTTYRVLNLSASHGNIIKWIKFLISANDIKLFYAHDNKQLLESIETERLELQFALAYLIGDYDIITNLKQKSQQILSTTSSKQIKRKLTIYKHLPKLSLLVTSLRYKNDNNPTLMLKIMKYFRNIV